MVGRCAAPAIFNSEHHVCRADTWRLSPQQEARHAAECWIDDP